MADTPPGFDEVYAAQFADLTVQLYAYFGDRQEPQVDGPDADRVVLIDALTILPDAHRRVVVLHYLADLSIAEIAERENVAPGTVKSWLHRGRAKLAAHLEVPHA